MQEIFRNIRLKIINWTISPKNITIEEIYNNSNPLDVQIPDPNGNLKFTGEGRSSLLVKTPTGYSPIKRTLKTIPYDQWELTLEDNKQLICADEHIVITSEGEKYVKDLTLVDEVLTVDGQSNVKHVKNNQNPVEMYDLELHDENHVFYTNGILSHNTTLAAMYILWFALFHQDKKCIIASKQMSHATEIMDRIKFAYEELPSWIKAGCKFYNRTSIEFDNGSKIKCEATSPRTGRGESPAVLFIDEIAHISQKIQEEMWASLTPALSTGGKFILTSTPNGDTDLFATLWRGANSKTNSFYPVEILWHRHPDRGQEYYDDMKGKLGELMTRQELDCHFLSSDALLINSLKLINIKSSPHVFENMGFKFWKKEEEIGGLNKTYLVSLDPATGDGSDFSAIEVFEFPSLFQIAEFRTNDINIPLIYAKLKWVLNYLSQPIDRGRAEVLWTFERNGVGEAISALYFTDESQPEHAELFSDHDTKLGVFTSGRNKIVSCLTLKTLVEKVKNGFELNSDILIHELKNFVAKGGSYAAKNGSTDDAVMATVGIVRLLKRLSDYNDDAFARMNEQVAPDYEENADPMPMLI